MSVASDVVQSRDNSIYDRIFWLAYVANIMAVMSHAITYRFADLVRHLGGTEETSGYIVSMGLTVAVAARLSMSHFIDDYGTRRIWTFCSLLCTAGCVAFLFCHDISWLIYAARIAFHTGLSGMFACSMTHIQNHVPVNRRTEVIGNLGSSGFIGVILGSNVSDLIVRFVPNVDHRFMALFGTAAGLGFVYTFLIRTFPQTGVRDRSKPSQGAAYKLLFKHWPGAVFFAAMIMGLGHTATTVFLTRFATSRNIEFIGVFFTVYAISAFVCRLSVQNWGQTIGRRWMLFRGLMGHTLGHFLIPFCTETWHLIIPAMICGFGHAILFPAVVSLGAGAFPSASRGSGTAIILGVTDLGGLVFAPILGTIIVTVNFTWMFWTSAAAAFVTGVAYFFIASRYPDEDLKTHMQIASVHLAHSGTSPVPQAASD